MRIPEETVERIKAETDILDVIGEYISLKKRGANYFGSCPFHTDKTPSFSVSPERNSFHCFSCGAGGDAISFLMQNNHLSFVEALRYLAEKKGIPITEDPEETKRLQKEKTIYDLNQEAMRFYYKNLLVSKTPKEYLEKREIDHDTINRFYLGYAKDSWDDLYNHLKKNGFNIDDAVEVGLLAKSEKGRVYDYFRNRLMFPIFDTRNRVIGFGARTLGDDAAKYLNSKESMTFVKGNHLYGLQNVTRTGKQDPVILTEGYMDVIQMVRYGFTRTVASLGTALTENQAKLLKHHAGEIYILYDGDAAGIRATNRAIEVLEGAGIRPKIIQLEEGLDPDDYLKQYGEEAMDKAIDNALVPTKYFIREEMKKYNLNQVEERVAFVEKAAEIIARLDRSFERDEYIKSLATQAQLDPDSLLEEVQRKRGATMKIGYKKEDKEIQKPKQKGKISRARGQLMVSMLAYSLEGEDEYNRLSPYWNEEFIIHEGMWNLATSIREKYEKKEILTVDSLVEEFAHDKTYDGLMGLFRKTYHTIHGDTKAEQQLFLALQTTVLKEEQAKLLEEIEWLSQSDPEEVKDILAGKIQRLQEINKQLTSKRTGGV